MNEVMLMIHLMNELDSFSQSFQISYKKGVIIVHQRHKGGYKKLLVYKFIIIFERAPF